MEMRTSAKIEEGQEADFAGTRKAYANYET
jgi:hypothetical protein